MPASAELNSGGNATQKDTKRLIAWCLLACAALVLLSVSACGESSRSASDDADAVTSAVAPEASPPQPTLSQAQPGGSTEELGIGVLGDAEGMSESENFQPATQEPPNAGELESGITGVLVVPISSAEHVRYKVEYPTSPPAGGPHLPFWLNCGYYEVPVLNELAVHSLEHGAVWVTYLPGVLEVSELESLAAMAAASTHLLVSPYSAQDTAIVLSAWGRQLPLESIDDERFGQFLDVYLKDGPTAPEPSAACHEGIGIPPNQPSTQAG